MLTTDTNIIRTPASEPAVEAPAPGDIFADINLPPVPDVSAPLPEVSPSAGLPVPSDIGGIGTAKLIDAAFSLGVLALGIAAVKKMFKWIYSS